VLKNVGYSDGNVDFSYIITLSSVSPSTGSSNGGSLVTLTGTNFSNSIADNAVFFTNG
jgi:hypothetical protein